MKTTLRCTKSFFKALVILFIGYHALSGVAHPLAQISCGLESHPPERVVTFWMIFLLIGSYYVIKHIKSKRAGVNRFRKANPIFNYSTFIK